MISVLILNYSVIDNLNRIKKTTHHGVFKDLKSLNKAKRELEQKQNNIIFHIVKSDHLFHNVE